MSFEFQNNNNDNNNNSDNDISIENVFELIKQGKKYQSLKDYWMAATTYLNVKEMLQQLASNTSNTTNTTNTTNKTTNTDSNTNSSLTSEQEQIVQLYLQQANEYFFQSRQCLIDAMNQEYKNDQQNQNQTTNDNNNSYPFEYLSLTDEQAEMRTTAFCKLFSKQQVMVPESQKDKETNNDNDNNNKDKSEQEQIMSLEERLQILNASIPSGLKSSKERMDDLNKGLNRLGLSLYTQKEPFARFKEEISVLPKDEDEQIADIMAQVQDEVLIEKQQQTGDSGGNGGVSTFPKKNMDNHDNFDDLTDSENEDDMNDEDHDKLLLLEDEELAMELILRKVVKAQTKLAQLVAYLEEAKVARKKEDDDDNDDDDDIDIRKEKINDNDDNDNDSLNDDIERPDSTSYILSAKKKLRKAQRDLSQALEEWNDNLS